MRLWAYKKYIYYIKSISTCIVLGGSCWFIYQIRETSHILRSTLATNVLDLEKTQAQYIYLDDPMFKDILTDQNDLQSLRSKKSHQSFSTIIFQWWESIYSKLAYRLLNIAKNGNKNERLRAIYTLGSLKHLKDWNYCHLAQMMDAKTAVALARIPNSDLRFFLKPPKNNIKKKLNETIDDVHQLLLKIDKISNNSHQCLTQFINAKFQDYQRDNLVFDHDLPNIGLSTTPASSWDQHLLHNCIKALYHHTSIEQFSKDIAIIHGLSILIDVKEILSNNIEVLILIAKIISNLSLHLEYLDYIFMSGWIGILTEWSRNNDVRLAAPASRALANLDTEINNNEIYSRRIYLLHPMHRDKSKKNLDVVFIHGLLGGIFVTWRQRDLNNNFKFIDDVQAILKSDTLNQVIGEHPQEFFKDLARDFQMREWNKLGDDFEVVLDDCPESINGKACGPFTCSGDDKCIKQIKYDYLNRTQCWPKDWLPKDLPGIRVLGINYDTSLSFWTSPCPIEHMSFKNTLIERSEEFVKKLVLAGVGKRSVVWVCHSMGGLIVKKMLVEEWKNGDKNNICKNTKGIIFYSTPHRGSHVAAFKQTTEMLVWPSIEVQELRQESPKLLKLHDEFLNMLKNNPMDIVSFSETKSTPITALKFSLEFVTSQSADPGVGEFYEIPQNHLTICKPANRSSFLYQKVVEILQKHTYKKNTKSSDNFLTWLFRVS